MCVFTVPPASLTCSTISLTRLCRFGECTFTLCVTPIDLYLEIVFYKTDSKTTFVTKSIAVKDYIATCILGVHSLLLDLLLAVHKISKFSSSSNASSVSLAHSSSTFHSLFNFFGTFINIPFPPSIVPSKFA